MYEHECWAVHSCALPLISHAQVCDPNNFGALANLTVNQVQPPPTPPHPHNPHFVHTPS